MKVCFRVAACLGLLVFFGPAGLWAAGPPAVGSALPDFGLTISGNGAVRAYLGLAGSGTFRITQIGAQVVVIEIFSMYCPYCQKEAPQVNRLYETIEADPALRGKVKLIGIGAGNSAFETGLFRDKYRVPFPLFPDGDFTVHKRLGEVRTPYFIAVRLDAGGAQRVVLSRQGAFAAPETFLEEVVRAAALK